MRALALHTRAPCVNAGALTRPRQRNHARAHISRVRCAAPENTGGGTKQDDVDDDVFRALDAVLGSTAATVTSDEDVDVPIPPVMAANIEPKPSQYAKDRPDPLDGFEVADDWFGLGPKWDVPHGALKTFLTMISIDATFYVAGFLAPIAVYSTLRDPSEVPTEAEALTKDLQNVFDDPTSFSDIFLTAEVMQIVLGAIVLGISMAPHAPLPKGWFNDVFSSDAPEHNAMGKSTSRARRMAITKAQEERRERSANEAGVAILGTLVSVSIITALLYLAGLRGGEEQTGAASVDIIEKAFAAGPHGVANLLLTTVILAPVFEEIIFRGYLLPSLTKYMPPSFAVALSAVIFALIHQHGIGDTVQLLAVGVACGVVYSRTRNLGASMLVHAAFNGTVIALFAIWTA